MPGVKEIVGYATTAAGLCLNLKDLKKICPDFKGLKTFSPWLIFLNIIVYCISTGLAVFDTYTDWTVVLNYKKVGFNNPILPPSIPWLRAWIFFASIGTVFTLISILDGSFVLLYSVYKSCKKHCCKKNHRNPEEDERSRDLQEHLIDSESSEDNSKDDESDDPCKVCYNRGWNITTRAEALGTVALWFQNVPMLTMSVLYAFSQSTCKVPDNRDVTPMLRDVGISAIAATLASSWRLSRSFVRLYSSVGVMVKSKDYKFCKKFLACLPKKGDAAYPPGTCAHCCIIPFYFGLVMQFQAIVAAITITVVIWLRFYSLKNPNFDDSLGIYRFSLNSEPDVHLFDISGTVIPSNGTFVNLEKIPSLEYDVFCLSEFEYRSEEYKIFFSVSKLAVVSEDGHFCVPITGPELPNTCILYYTFKNFVLRYASIDPNTGEVERFNDQCTAVKDLPDLEIGPVADFSIDVSQNIDRTGFPENDEPLIIFYPSPINKYVNVSSVIQENGGIHIVIMHAFRNITNNITCVVRFRYDITNRRINFNYRYVYTTRGTCSSCSFLASESSDCRLLHINLQYAYLSQGRYAVPYTHCSKILQNKLMPYHDPSMSVNYCPC